MRLGKRGVLGLWFAVACSLIALLKAVWAVCFINLGNRPNYMYDPAAESRYLQSALVVCSILMALALVSVLVSVMSPRWSQSATTFKAAKGERWRSRMH